MAEQIINPLYRAAFELILDEVIDDMPPGRVNLADAPASRALTKLFTTESINDAWDRQEEALVALRQAIADRLRSRAYQEQLNSRPVEEVPC